MSVEKIVITCKDKESKLDNLYDLLYKFRTQYVNYFGKFETKTEDEVFNSLEKILDEKYQIVSEDIQKIISFFENKLNKYWRMKIIKSFSQNDSCYEEYLIYPYQINKVTNYISCIKFGNCQSEYKCDMSDGVFFIEDLLQENSIVEMEEISKDIFIEQSKYKINEIIEHRLNKCARPIFFIEDSNFVSSNDIW